MKHDILTANYDGRDLVLTLEHRRRLNILIADKVKKSILKTARKKHRDILLDLHRVDFIDSAAIAMLMDVNERLSGQGIKFQITGVSKEVMELIQLVPVLQGLIQSPVHSPEPVLPA